MKALQLSLMEIFDFLPCAVFAKDHDHTIIYGNKAFSVLTGRDDFVGLSDGDLFPADFAKAFLADDLDVFSGSETLTETELGPHKLAVTKKMPLKMPDGTVGLLGIVIEHIRGPADDDEQIGRDSWLSFVRAPATALERRLVETMADKERALEIAHTDAATGLLNRNGFEANLKAQIEHATETDEPFAVVLCDIDYFKRINQRLGHAAGDTAIKAVGERLRGLPGVLSVARMGGDEFGIISTTMLSSLEDIQVGMQYVQETVFSPIQLGGHSVEISGSSGVALFPKDAHSAKTILECADRALVTAKRNQRGSFGIFDDQMRDAAQRRARLEECLPIAISEGLIRPVYQPILDSRSRECVGLEVLARWHDQALGHISPDEFIKAATRMGLISDLDRSVSDLAMSEARDWLERGDIEFISLNVSPFDIVSRGYATRLLKRIQAAGLRPECISIEVLESAIIDDIATARRNLDRLREAGVTIAIDDYGTGFSNLRALLDMPLDKLKIDRSLIAGIETNNRMLDLLTSIVQFSHALSLTIVAEGIETSLQAAFVEGAGCPQMQGYFFAKPMFADQAGPWLDDHVASRKVDAGFDAVRPTG